MRLFLDTSVLIAASGSARGASREIFRLAPAHGWALIATPYVIEEVLRNIGELEAAVSAEWAKLRRALVILDDVLTLDRGDFAEALGQSFYDLAVLKPGDFLQRERTAGRLTIDEISPGAKGT